MKIGALSKQSGVSIDTIRYYEKRGLIPQAARTTSGYRQYATEDVLRLKFIVTIQHKKSLTGFFSKKRKIVCFEITHIGYAISL